VRRRDSDWNADREGEYRGKTQERMFDEHAQRELYVEPGESNRVQPSEPAERARLGAMRIDVSELAARLTRGLVLGQPGPYEVGGSQLEVVLELRSNLDLDVVAMDCRAKKRAQLRDQCRKIRMSQHGLS
jgi:hypothetical protein